MKLNLGCGYNKVQDPNWLNVDLFPECGPDAVVDLEKLPWPWPDDSVEHVIFFHSLEHLGAHVGTFLGIMKELYRVCRDGAPVEIAVPHPRHDSFISDPTHVRVITPGTFLMLDRDRCNEIKRLHASNTPLAHYIGVDFVMQEHHSVIAPPYSGQYEQGLLTDQDIETLSRERNNIIEEYRIVLRVRKHR